ncbi:methyltransferase [Micromonospora sp. WMMA1363]|nr:methyltransferase [Micromonospora sp. WMMA1363]MDM4722816.1 methyltransferase [Micromonospora sp. WMMA1363]
MTAAPTTEQAAPGALVRQVMGDALGFLNAAALRVAVHLDIAEHLASGPKTPAELATLSDADPGHLARVLRFLAMRGVFREDERGAYHLTPAAELLRAESPMSVRSMVLLLTDEMYWLPAGRLEETVRAGTTVFNGIFGGPLFDVLARDPSRADIFNTAIADLSVTEQDPIAASYDFPDTGTVVDVGGGPGGLLHAILLRNPGLRGVLFEQESVLAKHRLGDPAIAGRWEPVAGDFFGLIPTGGDIYVLKRVLHDWDDADSLRILKATRQAMADEAKLLIIDAVIPSGNDPHPSKLYDIAMMTNFDGKERTKAEFDALLAAANLRAVRVIPTPGTLSIVEAVPAPPATPSAPEEAVLR